MAAVVAVMAALAALGRDAFVALPDVKPITAMTFVVGYALGPLPGFTVGALGMLVSNFVLGQGPYTPWQMAAWGHGRARRRRARARSRARLVACRSRSRARWPRLPPRRSWTCTRGRSAPVHTPAAFLAVAGQGAALRRDRRRCELPVRPRLRSRARAGPGAMRVRMDVTWTPTPKATGSAEEIAR